MTLFRVSLKGAEDVLSPFSTTASSPVTAANEYIKYNYGSLALANSNVLIVRDVETGKSYQIYVDITISLTLE